MAESVLKLRVDSQEYESKIKRAAAGLQSLGTNLRNAGKTFADVDKEQLKFIQELGNMETVSKTAKGKVNELSTAFIDLKTQYNQMSDSVKQSDAGKALAESINNLKQRTIEAKKELEGLNREISTVKMPEMKGGGGLFSGIGDKMSGAMQVFAGNMLTKAAGAVANLGSEMYDMVQQGVELAKQGEGIRIAFERLGRGDILDGLREATHGTVTDLELMKAAVKFNDFKLPIEELGTMLAFAQQKAKDTGQSVDYMVDSIVTGLGRKSLMILDNLGLSATEVKEKMKETGDMTKAVGEIIREQMSKAGDYVETAADRAAQADVELKNSMEELGRTFQPLTDASDSLWNSIKVGALNALNTAVKPLIQALSEAGTLGQGARSSAGFNNLGGNTKVDRMIGRLGNGKTAGAYGIYQQQLGEFDKYINNKRFQIAAFGGDNSSVAQSAKAKLQTELDGALKMRAEYVKRAQELHNKVPSPYEPPTSSSTTNAKGGSSKTSSKSTSEPTFAADSIAAQAKLVSDLQKKWNEAGEDMRTGYLYQLIEAENKLKSMKDEQKALRDMTTWGDLKGAPVTGLGESSFSGKSLKDLQGVKLELKLPKEKTEASLTKEVGNMAGGISQMVGSMEALGIELPEGMKDVVNGVTSLISIVSGIATIVTAIEALTAADTIIPFARGGIVKAASGTIVGNSYSGDNLRGIDTSGHIYGLNAGEVVLNRSQVGNLASQLQGSGFGGMHMVGEISGEKIVLVANRFFKRTGQGEIVTW